MCVQQKWNVKWFSESCASPHCSCKTEIHTMHVQTTKSKLCNSRDSAWVKHGQNKYFHLKLALHHIKMDSKIPANNLNLYFPLFRMTLNSNKQTPRQAKRQNTEERTRTFYFSAVSGTSLSLCLSFSVSVSFSFWTKGHAFSFCTGPHKLCSQSWQPPILRYYNSSFMCS